MNKILFIAVSLFSLLTISCSNDDIEIEKVDPLHDVTLNISTQNMYDEFGITNRIRDGYLRDGGRVIGITTFVYDSKGNLVKEQMTPQNNFNNVSQTFEGLVEGDYTFVTVETLLNPDDDYKAEDWTFDDTEKLSTVKISQVYTNLYYGSVLGVATTNVSLSGDQSINITPKAIGSLVKYYPYDLEETNFVKFAFVTNDVLDYYSLNPQLQRKDKFHEDLSKKNTVNVRCMDDIEESTGYYWTFYLLEPSIEWMNAAQTEADIQNNTLTTWPQSSADLEDGKTYEAGFYYLYSEGESIYSASYFGDEAGLKAWEKEWTEWKENRANSNVFTIPYINWNVGTVSAVKNYMSEFTLYQDIQYNEDDKLYDMIFIDMINNFTMYRYVFKSSTSDLTDSYVYLDGDYFTLSQVRSEVEKQGYTLNSQNNNNYYYTSSNTYVIVYQAASGLILVNYYNPKAYGLAPKHSIPEVILPSMCNNSPVRKNSFPKRFVSSKSNKAIEIIRDLKYNKIVSK